MTLLALLSAGYILINAIPTAPSVTSGRPLRIEPQQLAAGEPLQLEWQGRPITLLKSGPVAEDREQILVIFNHGTRLGCPLDYSPPGSHDAPIQPWPGGFRESCADSWYDTAGEAIPESDVVPALLRPPYHISPDGVLWIGDSP